MSTPGALDPSPSRPGQRGDIAGPQIRARVARLRWSNPRDLGTRSESPGTAGQHREPSDTGLSRHGQLVDPAGYRSRPRVLWDSCSNLRPSDPSSSRPEERMDPADPRSAPEAPGTAGQPRRHWNQAPGRLGHLVEPPGPQAWARVSRGSWSTPWAQGHGPGAPGPAGRPRGHWNPAPGRPGHLVEPMGPGNRVRVARDSWSAPRALDTGPSHPGEMVDPTGPWT